MSDRYTVRRLEPGHPMFNQGKRFAEVCCGREVRYYVSEDKVNDKVTDDNRKFLGRALTRLVVERPEAGDVEV